MDRIDPGVLYSLRLQYLIDVSEYNFCRMYTDYTLRVNTIWGLQVLETKSEEAYTKLVSYLLLNKIPFEEIK